MKKKKESKNEIWCHKPARWISPCRLLSFACFFCQAEDVIRDFHVTGVQTCALPISRHRARWCAPHLRLRGGALERCSSRGRAHRGGGARSEERRVGKECRSRWS